MKSYNHLWEIFISDENIDAAIKKAVKGKRKRRRVRQCLDNPNFHNQIKEYAQNFYNYPHKPIEIYDGISRKKRNVGNFRRFVRWICSSELRPGIYGLEIRHCKGGRQK